MKNLKLISSALLVAAGMNCAFAETLTDISTSSSGVTTTAGGTYGGVMVSLDSSWLENSLDPAKAYGYELTSVTIEGRQATSTSTYSWADSGVSRIVIRETGTDNYIGISAALASLPTESGASVTFSGFTGLNGSAVTLASNKSYDFLFVQDKAASGTSLNVSSSSPYVSVTGGTFVTPQIAAYSNSSLSTSDSSTGFVNSNKSAFTDYKPGITLTGTVKETVVAENKTLNLYVLTGQSNSLGAVKGSPLSNEMLEAHATDASQVKFWHSNFNKDSTTPFAPSTTWGDVVPQIPAYNGNYCMGPEYGFAYMIAEKGWQELLGGNAGDIGILKASLDGGGNSYWLKGGNAYVNILSALESAVAKAKEDGYTTINIVGLMYLQGESNSTTDAAVAGTRLQELLSNLQEDFGNIDGVTIADGFHVAAGENATWNLTSEYSGAGLTTRDNLYAAVSAETEDGTTFGEWVPTHDLAKITSGDTLDVHYDGQSQLTIGARYAYAEALRAGYVEEKSIRNFNLDAALDSADAYHSGKISSTEVVTWDVASSAITKVSETDSSVKLYGIKVDADAGNYLQTGATRIEGEVSAAGTLSADDARLIIGAGGIDIGKNLTLATNLGADEAQTWTLAEGATLQIDGSLFAELSGENLSEALITKEGAGTLKVGDDAALGIIFDSAAGLAAGEYTFLLFDGFSEGELSAFEKNLTFLSGDGWLAETMVFDAAAGTLTVSYIPEPSAFGLLAGTCALVFSAARRRKKTKLRARN